MPTPDRAQYWVFTINNPDEYQIPREWEDVVKYCIWQAEVGEQGTEHLQGYVVFNGRMRLSQLKLLNGVAHWEGREGTHDQAKHYCMKPVLACKCKHCTKANTIAGPWQYGDDSEVPRKKGQRTDLTELRDALDEPDMDMRQVSHDHFGTYLKYHRGIESYMSLKSQHRPYKKPKIFIFWGKSGSGKSRLSHKVFPNAYRKMKNEWWQGYQGQTEVVFDDFYGWMPFDDLLRILDFYEYTVQVKGGSRPLAANVFIFTSNIEWDKWYKKLKDAQKEAFERRIQEFGQVHYFDQYSDLDEIEASVREALNKE